jgi:hypothetical protein
MADLITYLTEDQHDRLYEAIKNNEVLKDIVNALSESEYCECFECENGA